MESVERIAEKQIAGLENQLKEREEDLRESQRSVEQLTRQDQIRYEIIREAEKQRDEARTALEETMAALEELHRVQEASQDFLSKGPFPIRDPFATRARTKRMMHRLAKEINAPQD